MIHLFGDTNIIYFGNYINILANATITVIHVLYYFSIQRKYFSVKNIYFDWGK